MSKIIGTYWFSTFKRSFGIIKVNTDDGIRFYIGSAQGEDEKKDAKHIMQWGAPCNTESIIQFLTDDRVKEFQEDDTIVEVIPQSKTSDYIIAAICFSIAIGLIITYIAQIQL